MTRTLFGTDGVRGVAGIVPMRAEDAFALGAATALHVRDARARAPRLLIGTDTRRSGPMLAQAFAAGAMAHGAQVSSFGVLPTPGVAFFAEREDADAAAVISASHNPFADNGIKLFAGNGEKLPDEEEASIEARLASLPDVPPASGREVGTFIARDDAEDAYLAFLLSHAPFLDGMRVGLDGANGAASRLAPALFRKLGARLQAIHVTPDGFNINADCGSTAPEAVRRLVLEQGLDVGVTFDGDADRALLCDRRGRMVSGDHVLAIVARVRGDRELVATVMTNLGIERWLQGHGVQVHRTQVGDRYVLQELKQRELRLGGEASGHVLFRDKAATGDGMLTALQALGAVRASGRSLEAWMDEIPVYPQTLVNVPVAAQARATVAAAASVQAAVTQAESELGEEGRVLLRPSGTEPVVRVMVEGRNEEQVHAMAQRLAAVVQEAGAMPDEAADASATAP